MSLQVWLPLDGDLRNQGLDGSGFFRNNSAVWGDGKIGSKAYLTSTGTNTATFSSLVGVKEFSIAYWLKIDSSLTFSNYQDFWQVYYTNRTGTGPIRDEHNSTAGGHQLLVYKETDVGSNTNPYWPCSVDSAENVWVHIVLTKNLTQTKTYCNGVLKQVQNNTVYESSTGSLTGDVRIGNATCGGYLNDFRIYDHALSVKEVKEIAKGLVLHYPLNKPQANIAKGGNTYDLNLNSWVFSNQNGGTVRTLEYDEYGTPCVRLTRNDTAASGWSYFHYDRIENTKIKTNTTYTISFDIKASVSGTVGMSGFMQGNATNQLSNSNSNIQNSIIANKWNHIILQTTTKSDFSGLATTGQIIYMSLSSNFRNTGATMLLKNIKLEEGNKETPWIPNESDSLYAAAGYASGIVYDCSGYQNNGTEVGTITGSSDTPRYRSSSKFSNSSYITYQLPSTMYYATYSFWLKFSSFTKYGAINMQTSNPGGGDGPWFSCNTEGAQLWAYFGGNSPNYTKARYGDLLTNTWYHCVYVWDNGVAQWYLNGEKSGNATTYTDKKYISNSTTATIGNSYTGSNWNGTPFDGQLSDFRIYATALSAEDIKALYNESASIDKNGNFHAYEYVEDDSIIKVDINKQGVFTAPEEIIEDNLKEPSIDNKNIYAKGGFYED